MDAACVLSHDELGGTIIDISMGGLSCMCFPHGGKCSQKLSVQVNIYCKKHDLCAEGIRLKVLGTEMIQGKFIEKIGMRKCRARFYQLDKTQQLQVTNIIANLPLS